MEAIALIFWGLALVPYSLYPLVLRTLGQKPKSLEEAKQQPELPSVSVVFAAYNEEANLARMLDHLLAQDYPGELEVWVGSDQSTDRSDEILSHYSAKHRSINWIRMEQRSGKAQIINRLVSESTGDWLVGTDANILFAPDCISQLLREAELNPKATMVGGSLFYRGMGESAGRGIADQERWYINWENFAKRVEYDRTGCAMGVEGGLYAIRREAFRPIPFGTFMEDFYLSFSAMLRGEDVAWSLNAVASEDVSHDRNSEFNRKVRIAHGNWQNIGRFVGSLHRLRLPVLLVFLGHKLLRWAAPLLVVGGILLGLIPGQAWSETGQMAWTLFAGLSAYTLVLRVFHLWLWHNSRMIKIPGLRLLNHLLLMNLALGLGFLRYLRGRTNGVWEPTPRTNE